MKKRADQDNVVDNQKIASARTTTSGIELKPVYGSSPLPGEFPYTRGPYRSMYRQKFWTMRQYSGFGSAKETNARFHYLLKNGQTGLSSAFDLPTQMGYDSDHEMAEGEVGRVGVAISHIEDMKLLLAKLPLDQISTSMTINSTAAILLCLYIAVAKDRKINPKSLRGTIQNDILKEYIARGTYIYPADFSLKLVADVFRFSNTEVPRWNPISISGYHIREAGSTAAQEIAFTLSNAFAYVETALKSGLRLENFVPRLSFFFNVHNNFFEEIAKFRVARKIYAEEMVKRFHAPKESVALKFHAQTAGSTLTAQQPINNSIRVAYQALAAALGGAQSLHTNSYDEALALPTEESALLALRTQQILAEETGIASVADPISGSSFLEDLGQSLEEKTRAIMNRVAEMGGMLSAIETGYVQREIQSAAFEAQKKIDSGEQKVVGVNCFSSDEKTTLKLHQMNPKVVKDQLSRLKKFKANRKSKAIEGSLKKIEGEVKKLRSGSSAEVCESILSAVENRCTLGEISDVMRNIAGTYHL
ncbi:MAG: methylmalonyl-CoA mutase [Bacteriovoracaceae bacterium]|nr:methylmalonyl-CoA mutase [Bacteriovoracaceae bacterium]